MRALLLIFTLAATLWSLEINECQSDIYYGNGIMTTKDEAWNTLNKKLKPAIRDELYNGDAVKMNKMHHFDVAYNFSAKEKFGDTATAMILDLMEAYQQMSNTSLGWWVFDVLRGEVAGNMAVISNWSQARVKKYLMDWGLTNLVANFLADKIVGEGKSQLVDAGKALADYDATKIHDDDLKEMQRKYVESIESGHGVILITHSQGNLFALEAVNRVLFSMGSKPFKPWMRDYVYHVSIASPAPNFASDHHWLISLDNDIVANIPGSVGTTHPNPVRYFTHKTESIRPAMHPSLEKGWVFNPPLDASSPDGYWLKGVTPPEYTKVFMTDSGLSDQYPVKEYTMHVVPDEWQYLQTEFHAFDYYFGLMKLPAYDRDLTIIPQRSMQTRKDILKGIGAAIGQHAKAKSQWKTNSTCLTNEHNATLTHIAEALPAIAGVYVDDANGKLFNDGQGYVKAACGTTVEREDDNASGPDPKSGIITVDLQWEHHQVDMELVFDAGEKDMADVEDVAREHYYVATEDDISPGTYTVSVYGFTDVPFIEKGAEQCGIEEEPITLAVNTPKENILFAINAGSAAELNMGAVVEIEVSEKGTTIIRPSGGSGSGGGGHIQVLCINDCHYFPQGIYESYNYETITLLSQALMGPLIGAEIKIYRADNYENNLTALVTGTTSEGSTIYTSGLINLPVDSMALLDDETYYVVEIAGGKDIDANDDKILDAMPIINNGKLHALLSGKEIKAKNFKINVLTEIAYQIIRPPLQNGADTSTISQSLDEIAQRLLQSSVNNDTIINKTDLHKWIPSRDKSKLFFDYDTWIAPIVSKIYTNEAIYEDAYSLVYEPHYYEHVFEVCETNLPDNPVQQLNYINNGISISSYSLSGDGSERFTISENGTISSNRAQHYDDPITYSLNVTAYTNRGDFTREIIIHTYEMNRILSTIAIDDIHSMAYGNKRTILFVQTQNETYIIDVHDPKNPQITAILTAANTVKLSSNETFAILGTDHGLELYDLSNFSVPVLLHADTSVDAVYDLEFSNDMKTLYVASKETGLHILGISDNFEFVQYSSIAWLSSIAGVEVLRNQNLMYVMHACGIDIFDISIPENPNYISTYYECSEFQKILLSDDEKVLHLIGQNYLRVIDVTKKEKTLLSNLLRSPDKYYDITHLNQKKLMLSANGIDNLILYDIYSSSDPKPLQRFLWEDNVTSVVTSDDGDTVFTATDKGLKILDFSNIDIPLKIPEIKAPLMMIEAAASIGETIGQVVVVSDGRSEIVSFELEGEGAEDFAIDSNGIITVANVLDPEKKTRYELRVVANNLVGSGETDVNIRVQAVPVLHDYYFMQSYDLYSGSYIGTIDLGVYHTEMIQEVLLNGNDADSFHIDNNGHIYVADNIKLDMSLQTDYTFNVSVRNQYGISNSAMVKVILQEAPMLLPFDHLLDFTLSSDGKYIYLIETVGFYDNTLNYYAMYTLQKMDLTIPESIVSLTSNTSDKYELSTLVLFDAFSKLMAFRNLDDGSRDAIVLDTISMNKEDNYRLKDVKSSQTWGKALLSQDATLLYVTEVNEGLHIIDSTEIMHLNKIKTFTIPSGINDIETLQDKSLLIAASNQAVYIIDVSTPTAAKLTSSISIGSSIASVAYNEQTKLAAIAAYESGILIIDMKDPTRPNIVSNITAESSYLYALDVAISPDGSKIAWLDYETGCHLVDITDPFLPKPIARYAFSATRKVEFLPDTRTLLVSTNNDIYFFEF